MELEIDALKERIADTERYVADISAKQEEKRKELGVRGAYLLA